MIKMRLKLLTGAFLFALTLSGYSEFVDFWKGATDGVDTLWSNTNNWTGSTSGRNVKLPASVDSARAFNTIRIQNGTTGTAGKFTMAVSKGFTIDSGGVLNVGSSGIEMVYNSSMDVSGSISSAGVIKMSPQDARSQTVTFRSGSLISMGGMILGSAATDGTCTVSQLGGTVNFGSGGALLIADTAGATGSGFYSISGGSLSAKRLDMGGDGATTAKFSVTGSDADISFSDVSFLAGQTELEFILGANGISTLDMTAGGYTAGGTAIITVNAANFEGAIGTEVELIDINSGGSLSVFGNENLTGGSLDYRVDDGLYFVTEAPPTISQINLWNDSFVGTTFDDSWSVHAALSTITQNNELLMTPDANGFARAFLASENSQAQASGDPAVTFNGNPAYNFFDHDLEITIDGLSMPKDVVIGNQLFIAGVSGGSVSSSDGPRQGMPGAFLRANTKSGTNDLIDLGMLEATGTSRSIMDPQPMFDLPDSIVLTMNETGWDVEITGTTFTNGTTSHSGVWTHIDSTILDANAVLVVGSYNENTASPISEMSISRFEVNAMASLPPVVVINPAVMFIDAGADFVTVSATGLTAAATYSLDSLMDLTSTNWNSVDWVTGVSETNWVFQATNPAAFYRMESQ